MKRGAVVITGAAGGIGQALTRSFHHAGCLVIATDFTPRPDGLLCDHYLEIDARAIASDADFSENVFKNISSLVKKDGLIALINNAAVQVLGKTKNLDRESWKKTIDINVMAPFFWSQGLLNDLERSNGSILNISSIHARQTKPNFVAYATSKAALSGMTRAMAVDLGHRVRVNAIEPAAIATDMLKSGFKETPEKLARLESFHPQGRIGTPEEIASLAMIITLGELQFLHGSCVTMDGGISGRLHDPD